MFADRAGQVLLVRRVSTWQLNPSQQCCFSTCGPRGVAFSSRVLEQVVVAGVEVRNFAVADLHRPGANEQDVKIACWSAVDVPGQSSCVLEESDPLSRLPLRYGEGGRGIVSKLDSNIFEVAFTVRPGEQTHILHVAHRVSQWTAATQVYG